MSRISRSWRGARSSLPGMVLGALLGVLLGACGSPANDRLGYALPDENGIGGTGILAGEDGIGGTGIVGEITGFGSIFVNGVEVEITPQTRIAVDGEQVGAYRFQRGEVVALRVGREGNHIIAHEAFVARLLIGPVTSIDTARRSMVVLGQPVRVGEGVALPRVGTGVAVSGFRDGDGVIHATHLAVSEPASVMITGIPTRRGNSWFLGNLKLEGLDAGNPETTAGGRPAMQGLRLWGRLEGDALHIERVQKLADLPFTRPVEALIWQGFPRRLAGDRVRLGETSLQARITTRIRGQLSAHRPLRLSLRREKDGWRALMLLPDAGLPRGRALPDMPGTSHPGMPAGMGMPPVRPAPPPMRPPGRMW